MISQRKILFFIAFFIAIFFTITYISHQIKQALDYLQDNIETRALPVLRKDIPIINKKFLGIIPSAQSILGYAKIGPVDAAKLTQSAIGVIEQPIINRMLEKTRADLNEELRYIKVNNLTFKRDGKRKTVTAYCSYGITVIITGKHFNKIKCRDRHGLVLTFNCD